MTKYYGVYISQSGYPVDKERESRLAGVLKSESEIENVGKKELDLEKLNKELPGINRLFYTPKKVLEIREISQKEYSTLKEKIKVLREDQHQVYSSLWDILEPMTKSVRDMEKDRSTSITSEFKKRGED